MNAIEFENISKQYRLGLVSTGTIANDLNRWWTMNVLRKEDPYLKIGETNDRSKKGASEYVWALKDINFKVEQGDVVGIIGKNGAGKSTLLKLLSRVTTPTTGQIRVRGRIASLLEVGTGFHPEMTGRENIFMNGAIMGMTKQEIGRKLDEIVDFSGCERYIDTPVKRYSSGMTVRLGFAIAAHLEPEILVVDEVLAVGDAEFQKKAIGKMQDVAHGQGRTVLFVSHNMAAVRNLCKKGIVLDNGTIAFDGCIDDSVDYYIGNMFSKKSLIIENVSFIKECIKIRSISVNGDKHAYLEMPSGTSVLHVELHGTAYEERRLNLVLRLKTKANVPIATFSPTESTGINVNIPIGDFNIIENIQLPRVLNEGSYYVDMYLLEIGVDAYMKAESCMEIHFQGSQGARFGRVLNSNVNGLFVLERV